MRRFALIFVLAHSTCGTVALGGPPPAGGISPSPGAVAPTEARPMAGAAQPLEAPPAHPLRGIPRLHMPQERIEGWIRDAGVKYVRIPADQFERLAAAKEEPGASDQRGETYLRTVRLSAKLAEDDVLIGRAAFDLHHLGGAPKFVALSPCTLALGESDDPAGGRSFARWTGQPPRRATLGVGDDGRLGVLVERSGEFEVAWTLRGRRSVPRAGSDAKPDGSGPTFRWEMPPATMCSLELDLPARWTPRVGRGVAESLGDAPLRKRWRIRLPAATTHELSLEDGSAPAPRADVTLRQTQTYRLWPHGIDLQTDLSLDVTGGPLHELELDLTPGLVLLAASTGAEQRVSWSPSGTAAAPRVRLHFPQPLAGSKQSVHLEATAPLRLDRPLTLPGVSPRDVFWQEGLATIWIAKSLSLESVQARGGTQSSGLAPQSSERNRGSQLAFRLFGPEAAIEIVVSRLRSRLEVSQATSLVWGASELRGRTIAEVACLEGECFDLWAEVGVPWTIEAVESTPSDLLADWERARAVDPAAFDAPLGDPRAGQFVHIRLTRPIRSGETARLTLTGRNLPSGGASLRWDDLEMLTFPQGRPRQRWLNVEATSGAVRLGLASGVREVSGSDLTLAQRPLFDQPPRGLILAVDAVTPQVEVVAERPLTGPPTTPNATAVNTAAAKEGGVPTATSESDGPSFAGAIVRRVHLESRYEPGGQARHDAIFEIESYTLSTARLSLPEGAAEIEVHVDGASTLSQADATEPLSLALGRGRRTIRLGYTANSGSLRLFTTVEAALPRWQSGDVDLPVLECAWTIAVPPGYEVTSAPGWQARDATGLSWTQRLFGPLARGSADRVGPRSDEALARGGGALSNGRSESRPSTAQRANTAQRARTYLATADVPLRARLVHRSVLATAGWLMFLAVAVGVWCFGPSWGRATGIAAAILLAAVMLSPEFCVPVAAGAFWGLVVGLMMKSLLPRGGQAAPPQAASESRSGGSSLRPAPAMLGVLWLLCLAGHASRSGCAGEATAWPVIVPSDAAASSDEAKVVYVPEALWERLPPRPPGATRQPAWIIERADYVARLSPPGPSGVVSAASLTATLSIRTALGGARVRLDFGASLGSFRPLEAILDGQAVALSWDAASRVCAVEIPRAGVHALELPLRASVRADGQIWQLEHPIPPVACAQVSLALPASQIATADVPSAIGRVTRSGRLLRGDLGAADRIVARWQDETVGASPRRLDVDQLLWLRVRAGAVALRAKWVCDAGRGQVRQFRAFADRGLRLNGDFHDGAGVRIRQEGELLPAPRSAVGPQVFDLTLDPPRSGRFTIECEFLVEDTHGIGRLRRPHVSGGEAHLDRQRLAVSVDANLKYEEMGFKGASAGAVGKFLETWGDADGRPDFVRQAHEISPQWSLKLRPHDVDRAAQQTLRADFGPRRVEVAFEASVTCTGGPCFQHRLLVPSALVAEQVSVTEAGQLRDVEWTTLPGVLNVFLRERAAGNQRIHVRGHVPISASGPVAVPAIQLDQAVTTSAETRLSQQAGVRVGRVRSEAPQAKKAEGGAAAAKAAGGTSAVPLAAPAASTGDPAGSRSLGAFATPLGTKLQVDLQPNRPTVRSPVLISTVRREGDQWLAGVEYDAIVTDILDTITFRGPTGLAIPTVLRPPGRVERQSVGGQARWHVTPKGELTGHCQIGLSWRLAPPTGPRLELPSIDALPTSSGPRFLAVAKDLAAASDRWEPVDLIPIKSWDDVLAASGVSDPKEPAYQQRLAKLREDLAGYDLYRAAEPGASFVIRRSTAHDAAAPARGTVDWQATSERGYHALATFTWPADGPAHVNLRLPEGSHLLRSTWRAAPPSDDKPAPLQVATLKHLEDGVWRLSFGPQPPRSLEVQFAGSRTSPLAGACDLTSVALVDAPVEETAWAVTLPPGSEAAASLEAESRLIDGRQVVSLTLPGSDSHALRLTVNTADRDSLGRRFLVLVALLGIGVGLAWGVGRWQIDPRLLIWLAAPAGLTWWVWLRPGGVGLAIAAASSLVGLWVVARIWAARHRALQAPAGPPTREGVTDEG